MKIWSITKIRQVLRNFSKDPVAYSLSFIEELTWERKLGIKTRGYSFPDGDASLYEDSHGYTPTSYSRLKKMVNYLKLGKEDVFIDLGCGAGRALFFVGIQRLKKIIGIEIRKEFADIAERNLRYLKLNNTHIEIINTDASAFVVREGTVFFMFNPFGEKTVAKIIENIKKSLSINPRKARIAYYGPEYRALLDLEDWLISEGEIGESGIFVWSNKSSRTPPISIEQ